MVTKKVVLEEFSFLSKVQYYLGLVIAILFGLCLFGMFNKVSEFLVIGLVIQFFLSLFRLRIVSVLVEFFLIILLVIIFLINFLIPIGFFAWLLSLVFFLISLIIAILDATGFRNSKMYKVIEVRTRNKKDDFFKSKAQKRHNSKKTVNSRKKQKSDVIDAEFEEK